MANQTLAVTLIQPGGGTTAGGVAGSIDRDAIDGSPDLILARAQSNLATKAQYLATLFGRPNIVAEGINTNDTTAVVLELVDLTTMGGAALFPAGTMRKVRWRHFLQTDNDRFFTEYERWVLGGSTPVLLGTRRVIQSHGVVAGTTVAYGNVHAQATYAQDTATAVTANSTAGASVGNNSTATITFTHPVCRATPKYVRGLNASSDADTATEHLHASAFNVNSTTMSIYVADLATPSQDGFDDVGVLDVEAFILPPGDCDLVMNSTNVEVQVLGIDADETRHRVEIFLEPPVNVAFQGAA